MKKVLILLFAMLLALGCAFLVTACDAGGDQTDPDAPGVTDPVDPDEPGTDPDEPGTDPDVHAHTMTAHAAVEESCETAGNTAYWFCEGCGKYFADAAGEREIAVDSWVIPATDHNFAEDWTADGIYHWHVCLNGCDEVSGKTEHVWDEGVITKQPTADEEGERLYTCTVCKKQVTQAIPRLDEPGTDPDEHVHTMKAYPAVEESCETAGHTAYWFCDGCGKFFADAAGEKEVAEDSWVIPATGHNFADWSYDGNYHWRVCLNGCGKVSGMEAHVVSDSSVVKEHSMVNGQVVNGLYLDYCSKCGCIKVVEDARHDYAPIENRPATCTTPAYEGGKACTICGDIIDAVVVGDPLGHVWGEERFVSAEGKNLCEEGGRYIYMCTRDDCKTYRISEDLDGRGHKVAEWSVTTAPTKDAEGVLTGTCTGCGAVIVLTLPTLELTNAGNGKAYAVTGNDPSCVEDTIYTYTYTMAVDAVTEIDSVAGLTTKTTVTYTGDAAFTWSGEVTVEGGNHYTLNWLGEEVAIEVDEIGESATKTYNIDEYPDFVAIDNILGDDCQTTYNNGAYFICEHCGESIAVNVTGRHTYEGELKVTPADCTTPAHIDVECTTCDDVVTIWTDEDRTLDEDNHAYASEPTIVSNQDDPSKATITFTCANNPADDHKLVLENATLVGEPEVTYENGYACKGATITKYTYEVNGETYIYEQRTDTKGHYVTAVNGQQIFLTDAQIAGTKDDPITNADAITTSPNWKFLDNVPQSCGDAATRCAYITCECCGYSFAIYYKPAHTQGEKVSDATCEKAAVYNCTVCLGAYEVGEPLGHDYVVKEGESFVYDPDAADTTEVSFTVVCARELCANEKMIEGTYADLTIDEVQEQTCARDGIYDITFHDKTDSQDYTFKNVNIGRLPHHYNGEEIDATRTTEYVVGTPGLTLFDNAPVNCGEAVASGGFFICEDCGASVAVNVKGLHTPGEAVKAADHTTAAVYRCAECSEYYFEGKPVEHEWTVKDGGLVPPTENKIGSVVYVCACGAEETVLLPVLSSTTVWSKTLESGNCEEGVFYQYTATIRFTVAVSYMYDTNEVGLAQTDVLTYEEEVRITSGRFSGEHLVDADPVYYEWVWPVGENSVTYVSYICARCGQMIVVWESGDDPAQKPADAIQLFAEQSAEFAIE